MITIQNFSKEDWNKIAEIYRKGIATGIATFETKVHDWETWDSVHLDCCRFKAVMDNKIVGWAALSRVSSRYVYRGVAEVSVYVDPSFKGLGIGTYLLEHLVSKSEEEGFWTLQSGIFSNNTSSIALHKKVGFREIGYREKIGQLNGRWYDNIIMEKRSKKIF